MNIDIINLSDVPAKFSQEELELGERIISSLWFTPKIHKDTFLDNGLKVFNSFMDKQEESIILFSSWWIESVNNIQWLNIFKPSQRKILLWFSDLLHIQSAFHNYESVESLYGITLRNIWELNQDEYGQLKEFLLNRRLSLSIEHISKSIDFSWKIFGGHLLIFSQIYEYFHFDLHNSLLYLEFHGMEEYMIDYIIDVLKLKNIFFDIYWVILEEDINENIIYKLQNAGSKHIYKLKGFSYLLLFQQIHIVWNNLIYEK
jgi:hypothetical protein